MTSSGRTIEHGSKRRRALGLVALALAAGLAGVLAFFCGPSTKPGPPADVPLQVTEVLVPAAAVSVQGAGAVEHHTLHVWLRALTRPRYTRLVAEPPFAEAWPYGVAWDADRLDIDALHKLRSLLTRHGQLRQGAAVVSAAMRDGLLDAGPPSASPEEAFARIVSEWVRAEVRRQEAWEDYLETRLEDGQSWEGLTGRERAAFLEADPSPGLDTEALVRAAREAESQWPDHPVADHARLAALWAGLPLYVDPPPPIDATVAAQLAAIDDPQLREQGALLLTDLGTAHEVAPEVLDAAYGAAGQDPAARLRLDAWIANRAARNEDWGRVQRSASRLATDMDAACAEDDLPKHACRNRAYELREHRSRLVALGLDTATTWQEALAAAVWRCHLDANEHRGRSHATLHWDGTTWHVDPWDHETPTTECTGRHLPLLGPPTPSDVALTIEADGGGS